MSRSNNVLKIGTIAAGILLIAVFQNCGFASKIVQRKMSAASHSPFAVSKPLELNTEAFGALGVKFKNGKIYVMSGTKLHASADGVQWVEEPSRFWQTSLQLADQGDDGETVYQVDSSPLSFDAIAGAWESRFIEFEGPNGQVKTPVTEMSVDNLPSSPSAGYNAYDFFQVGSAKFLTISSDFKIKEQWNGSEVDASVSESYLARNKAGSKSAYEVISRIGGIEDYKALLRQAGISEGALPLYYATAPRCFAFDEEKIVCAMRASADDDDHGRPLHAGNIFSAAEASPTSPGHWISGSAVYPLIYSPALDPGLWYRGGRDQPPLMIATSRDGGRTWQRQLIAARGGIDSQFAYDPEAGRLLIAYGALTYPRRGIAIQSSFDFGEKWSEPLAVTDDSDMYTSGTPVLEFVGNGKFVLVYDSLPNYFAFDAGPVLNRSGFRILSRTIQF